MSQWSRVGVKIQDVVCFKGACEKNGIDYVDMSSSTMMMNGFRIKAELRDRLGHSKAFLCETEAGLQLVLDNDPVYSSITKRLGANGGKLCRDYTQDMVTQGIRKRGGMINYCQEQPDGSIHIRATLM